ncbi:MAG: hypothetical protein Q8N09_10670 [Thermodesulfovibrionia bacterium]|nr:hypothetical protein [Thermodesulfovibrionia bacterium]
MAIDRKLINRAFLSKHDLDECNKFLYKFSKIEDDIIKEALLIAALIAYGRPFSENKENDKIIKKIPLELVTRPFEPSEKRLHAKLMTIRNKAIAHSDIVKKPTSSSVDGQGLVQQSKPYNILAEDIDINKMLNLSKKMILICEDIICGEQRKLKL